MAVGGYPTLFEDRDPRTWARQHLGHIPVLDPDLPATIQDVVRVIAHLSDPDRILLFGSRARGDHRELSDFDLYVEGVRDPKGLMLARLDATEGYLTLRQVDIVPDFEASDGLRERALQEGRVVYERRD